MYRYLDASSRLNIEFEEIPYIQYNALSQSIIKHFELKTYSKKSIGFDEIFQEFKHKEAHISLEWDNYSGYTIVAHNTQSHILLQKIAHFIQESYKID